MILPIFLTFILVPLAIGAISLILSAKEYTKAKAIRRTQTHAKYIVANCNGVYYIRDEVTLARVYESPDANQALAVWTYLTK